jgi:hypothetical protein
VIVAGGLREDLNALLAEAADFKPAVSRQFFEHPRAAER